LLNIIILEFSVNILNLGHNQRGAESVDSKDRGCKNRNLKKYGRYIKKERAYTKRPFQKLTIF
jgi:hypothetical protein